MYRYKKQIQQIKSILKLKLPPPLVVIILVELLEHGRSYLPKLR